MTRPTPASDSSARLLRFARESFRPSGAIRRVDSPRIFNPTRMAEDESLRSSLMRHLILDVAPDEPTPPSTTIPKVLVQFWHDASDIPADVQECLDSWQPLERQGFKRVFFDDIKARRFISKRFGSRYVTAFDQCHHPAMRCDYFRLCYMVRNGGFYVDADEFHQGGDCETLFLDNRLKMQPLCYDASDATMISSDTFTEEENDSPHWTFYVNNNPLVAPASHPVVRLALARSTRILLSHPEKRLDIQSTTGPGNLTASLIKHAIASELSGRARDFSLLVNWEDLSISRWPLSYRDDERNWRLWNPAHASTPR